MKNLASLAFLLFWAPPGHAGPCPNLDSCKEVCTYATVAREAVPEGQSGREGEFEIQTEYEKQSTGTEVLRIRLSTSISMVNISLEETSYYEKDESGELQLKEIAVNYAKSVFFSSDWKFQRIFVDGENSKEWLIEKDGKSPREREFYRDYRNGLDWRAKMQDYSPAVYELPNKGLDSYYVPDQFFRSYLSLAFFHSRFMQDENDHEYTVSIRNFRRRSSPRVHFVWSSFPGQINAAGNWIREGELFVKRFRTLPGHPVRLEVDPKTNDLRRLSLSVNKPGDDLGVLVDQAFSPGLCSISYEE